MSNFLSLRLPWEVIYGKDNGEEYVDCIQNCDGMKIIETDMGVYGPSKEEAEAIVNAVNEKYKER